MDSPVIQYSDAGGHKFNETSSFWKAACQGLPCFSALQWPDYRTMSLEDTIDGSQVVIQVWKGWCQKFLALEQFPGGIGAEVGVYHRVPGRIRPTSFPFLPSQVAQPLLDLILLIGDDDIWWPFPELNTSIEFTLTNPVSGETFFSAGPENTYWLNKWMDLDSYRQYQREQGKRWPDVPPWIPGNSRTPLFAADYLLDFKINGKQYPPWQGRPAKPLERFSAPQLGPIVSLLLES